MGLRLYAPLYAPSVVGRLLQAAGRTSLILCPREWRFDEVPASLTIVRMLFFARELQK